MFNKRQVKDNIKQIQRVKTWQLFVLLIMSLVLSATFLRLNNIGMVERRAAVVNADAVGDERVTKDRLIALQHYVSAHMNTDMGKGVYLESSYKKAVKAAYDSASGTNNVYKKAQEVCMPRFSNWSMAYIQCTVDELAKYPAGSNTVTLPNPNKYLHSFVSPVWSPDFAGWSLLISAAILTIILTRVTSVALLKIMLKLRYKRI